MRERNCSTCVTCISRLYFVRLLSLSLACVCVCCVWLRNTHTTLTNRLCTKSLKPWRSPLENHLLVDARCMSRSGLVHTARVNSVSFYKTKYAMHISSAPSFIAAALQPASLATWIFSVCVEAHNNNNNKTKKSISLQCVLQSLLRQSNNRERDYTVR